MMTCTESARLAISACGHCAPNLTASALAERQGTQNSGDGKLGESGKEQNTPLPFFALQYPPLLLFFPFVPAQPQQTRGSQCAFFDVSGWSVR